MKYISTRGKDTVGVSAAEAIKRGLAGDGGLYMPESIPTLTEEEIKALIPLSYPERAAEILSLFLTDYTKDELLSDARAAYSEEKFIPTAAPVSKLGKNRYMLELWHGPTSAFKDMALQIMPRLFVRALKKCGEGREALILVATSGDTGKAALEGYRDVDGTKIKVFYPINGVSSVQKRQMQSQEGANVSVVGIVGNFDDAQTGVKNIFSDSEFAHELDKNGVFLSSANSINWGRLVPQIVYYVSAYCDLCKCGDISYGQRLDVCVPTGNFGNIFAGYIAKLMGLPIGKLVCASNKNNVLTDFLKTGRYNRQREFFATMSPSMDILISSNLERLLYVALGHQKCAEYMGKLQADGEYTLKPDELKIINESFVGYFTDEAECMRTVKKTYESSHHLIDTHTAVALSAADRYISEYNVEGAVLTVSTASPYKFAADVFASLTGTKPECDLDAPDMLEGLTGVTMPSPLSRILKMAPIHTDVIEKGDMKKETYSFAVKK
ncbi:MAG: threonine synthase [Clostridia bacterium]|nr:threonine synthase [Clostridia bacterium]